MILELLPENIETSQHLHQSFADQSSILFNVHSFALNYPFNEI